jgi:translation initiation factor 1
MTLSKLVYSTSGLNHCSKCGKPLRKCNCASINDAKSRQIESITIGRETKGRKGAGVTVISGIQYSKEELKILAKELKILSGSGGTIKSNIIEIQGDHRAAVKDYLEAQGLKPKLTGR